MTETRYNEMFTPREELEARLGPVDDEKWRWLKEFCQRNYIPSERIVDLESKQVAHGVWCTVCEFFEQPEVGDLAEGAPCRACGCDFHDHQSVRVVVV